MLPDDEEIDEHLPEGSAAVMAVVRAKETLGSDVLATVSDGFFGVASRLTATAAAESAALAWSSYEVWRKEFPSCAHGPQMLGVGISRPCLMRVTCARPSQIPRCKWDWVASPDPPRGAEVSAAKTLSLCQMPKH